MACVSSGFRCSILFSVLFVASQALAKPGNNANSTPVSSSATKQCNYVYNSFYAGPNKKIETFFQEMKTQLTHVEDGINILKGNKTSENGKCRSDNVSRVVLLSGKACGSFNFITDFNKPRITSWSMSSIIHFAYIINFITYSAKQNGCSHPSTNEETT